MKKLIKLAGFLDSTITGIAIYTGLAFLVVLAVVLAIAGFAYVTQGVEPPSLTLSSFISETKAYLWMALPLLWAMAKALKWGFKVRNWWVHTEEHKLATGVRGFISWRFSISRR